MYRRRLPQEVQDVLKKHEDAGTTGSEEYKGIMVNEFFKRHMCSVTPWPEEFLKSFEWAEKDGTVGLTMYVLTASAFDPCADVDNIGRDRVILKPWVA